MDLDLRDLELLDALGHDGTLTAAAQRLFVSQPALSQRLTKMERRLGLQLFDREGRRLVANPAGRRLLVTARQVLGELRAAERDVRDLHAGRGLRVRFAAQCSTTFQWLPPILRRFRELEPHAEVRIETVPGDEPIAALLDDLVDVALVTKPDRQMDRVALTPLFEDTMVAVVAADHPWVGRSHVTARDFDDVHLILYDVYDPTRIPATALPLPPGARPARITTVPIITDLVVEMVAGGEGIAILPSWVATPYTAAGRVAQVQVGRRPLRRHWYCATRADAQPPHVAAFAATLIDGLTATEPVLAAPHIAPDPPGGVGLLHGAGAL
jgi:LysR family transcriptional regulator for metE and metH